MTDIEISKYLKEHNNKISSQDCIMNILNTSHQIISEKYDSDSKTVILKTPHNTFTFKLILGKL